MPNEETIPVEGIRLRPSDVKRLQVLALVYNRTVGELIREAVEMQVQIIINSEEFRVMKGQMQPGLALEWVNKLMGKKSRPARKPKA